MRTIPRLRPKNCVFLWLRVKISIERPTINRPLNYNVFLGMSLHTNYTLWQRIGCYALAKCVTNWVSSSCIVCQSDDPKSANHIAVNLPIRTMSWTIYDHNNRGKCFLRPITDCVQGTIWSHLFDTLSSLFNYNGCGKKTDNFKAFCCHPPLSPLY